MHSAEPCKETKNAACRLAVPIHRIGGCIENLSEEHKAEQSRSSCNSGTYILLRIFLQAMHHHSTPLTGLVEKGLADCESSVSDYEQPVRGCTDAQQSTQTTRLLLCDIIPRATPHRDRTRAPPHSHLFICSSCCLMLSGSQDVADGAATPKLRP